MVLWYTCALWYFNDDSLPLLLCDGDEIFHWPSGKGNALQHARCGTWQKCGRYAEVTIRT